MFRRLLRKYGAAKFSLLLTIVSILSSVSLYLIISFILGSVMIQGVIISIIVPAIVAPLASYSLLRASLKLDLAEENLRKARDALEQEVAVRTKDLTISNKRLRREIKERERAEEERKKISAILMQAQKMEAVGTISSGVAHNFRNMLSGISVNCQLIQMKYKNDPQLIKMMERIKTAVDRGSQLVKGLMQFSLERAKDEFRQINLEELIDETYQLICKSFDKKIDIRVHVPEPISINGDHSGLSQVLMNLCTNARDAMKDGGELWIKAGKEGENVILSVTDTGHGMDDEARSKCFDPFFTTQKGKGGTGLGLSTTYGIVKEHGGEIHVYSQPDGGTAFEVCFPIASSANLDKLKIPKKMVHAEGQKVLVVDDETEVLDPIEELLESMGYSAASVDSGEKAINKYNSWRPDVILMDRNMPGMDGITCAKKILKQDSSAKIILVSGYDKKGQDGIDSQTHALISGYITKPFDMLELNSLLLQIFKQSA